MAEGFLLEDGAVDVKSHFLVDDITLKESSSK